MECINNDVGVSYIKPKPDRAKRAAIMDGLKNEREKVKECTLKINWTKC